jgi:anti-anti-sigma factor
MKETDKEIPENKLHIEELLDAPQGCSHVRLKGRIDIFNYRDLAARLEKAVLDKAGHRLIVNMAGVGFVASSGWSVFMAIRAKLKRSQGVLVFVGLHGDLSRVYRAMKMDELVPSFATMKEAVDAKSI